LLEYYERFIELQSGQEGQQRFLLAQAYHRASRIHSELSAEVWQLVDGEKAVGYAKQAMELYHQLEQEQFESDQLKAALASMSSQLAHAHAARAYNHYMINQFEESQRDVDRALEIDKDTALAYLTQAELKF